MKKFKKILNAIYVNANHGQRFNDVFDFHHPSVDKFYTFLVDTISLGTFEFCCETERFFSPIICLKIHPCIYLKDYSDCFEGLSYSMLGFLIHSLELPIDFVNIEIFLISKKPLARSSRAL